jgi:predicted transposase/invertase (TIGR01784 family)
VRRDAIFYQLFQRFPTLLFSILDHPPNQAAGYRFESVEVKEPTFRIDGIFLPPDDASPKTVYFAEFQIQKDKSLYHRFFSESLLYLYRNQALYDDWYGVLIFASRSVEPENTTMHRALLNSSQVQRIYLDELGEPDQQPVEISLLQLTITPEMQMATRAKQLIERAEQDQNRMLAKVEILEIVTTIVAYKFANLTRQEVESMLGITFEKTRLYQDLKEEGRQEREGELLATAVPLLLRTGMTLEQIAEQLGVDVEAVHQAAQESSR